MIGIWSCWKASMNLKVMKPLDRLDDPNLKELTKFCGWKTNMVFFCHKQLFDKQMRLFDREAGPIWGKFWKANLHE